MLSPYDYWQFWRNTEDGDVGALPQAVHRCCRWTRSRGSPRCKGAGHQRGQEDARHRSDRPVHGREAAEQPPKPRARRSRKARSRKRCRRSRLPRADLDSGLGVLAAFVKAGLVSSNGEARRQIKGGGLRVNDATVTDEKMMLTSERPHAGRRDQALARKKAPRAAEAGVTGPGRRVAGRDPLRRVLLLEFEGRGVAACGTCERMVHERGLVRHRPDHADRHGARAMWTGVVASVFDGALISLRLPRLRPPSSAALRSSAAPRRCRSGIRRTCAAGRARRPISD